MKKKGFTLIELLSVILILGIIVLIAVPVSVRIIKQVKKNTAEQSVYDVVNIADMYINNLSMQNGGVFPESDIVFECNSLGCDLSTNLEKFNTVDLTSLKLKGSKPSSGYVVISNHGQDITVENLVINGFVCNYRNNVIRCDESIYFDPVLNGADPVLDNAMIPIIINNDGSIKKADIAEKWYDYSNKMWANVVLVSDESRSKYQNAIANTPIDKNDVKAYYVWIPRYRYQLFNSNSNDPLLISITFENKNKAKSLGKNVGEYLTHPAFTFGNKELNGIWVGKFETTHDVECNSQSACESAIPTVLPGLRSFRYQSIDLGFSYSQRIKYGLIILESSILKNSEWGAIAYLTTSQYGQGLTKVRLNNSLRYYTGCAASVEPTLPASLYIIQSDHSEGYYDGCENEWNTAIGIKASTTGNLYGIYDMSGGTDEYVMGFASDIDDTTKLNSNILSKFKKEIIDPKYYNIYKYNSIANEYSFTNFGDATFEVINWNDDRRTYLTNEEPILLRGGDWYYGVNGGIYSFKTWDGSYGGVYTFRSVLR